MSNPTVPSTVPKHAAAARTRSGVRLGFQALGFLVGLALLSWCISLALTPDNRQHLASLRSADRRLVAGLVLLSAASLAVNALAFWVIIRPVRRVPLPSVLAVNSIATALASLPFKLSVVCRFLVHHRRDGVPLLTITTWMGNTLTVMMAALAPIVGLAIWRPKVDAWWCVVAVLGVAISTTLVVGLARAASHVALWGWIERRMSAGDSVAPVAAEGAERKRNRIRTLITRFDLIPKAREGVVMLSHPSATYGAAGLRMIDITIQAARFVVAAKLLEQVMSPGDALIAAALYFIVGVASPAGALGFREAAVLGVHAAGSGDDARSAGSIIVLTITAIDTIVVIAAAIVSGVFLRIDRFFLKTPAPHAEPPGGPASTPEAGA